MVIHHRSELILGMTLIAIFLPPFSVDYIYATYTPSASS